ncbi:MAG: hypothetical protein H0T73_00370 [Ardenticatenales bacterium]|nr:hypothetical protein [Ardenticatenales bacterium]
MGETRIAEAHTSFHPCAWLLWVGAALTVGLVTQNPLYLTLLLLVVLLVGESVRRGKRSASSPLRWVWAIPFFTMIVNGLTIHIGETMLFRLPPWLPVFGGEITLEALLFGFLSGYSLMLLLLIFATFNEAADYAALLRLVPGFLFQAGLVTSIALAFVPQTMQALEEIREAQMIRGHRFRGWRDLPPLFLPLLTMGLERSIQLAEAMESRGFGGIERGKGRSGAQALRYRLLLLGGLLTLVVAISLLLFSTLRLWGFGLLSLGLVMLGFALWRMGRRVRRSRYRAQPWQRRDIVLALTAGGLLGGILLASNFEPGLFLFYPYPRATLPPFEPLVGGVILLLLIPLFLAPRREPIPVIERTSHDGII